MPVYEYKCKKCGKFEVTQKMTDDALDKCPTCGSPVIKMISRNIGIIFKSPGFYCTDNRSPSCDKCIHKLDEGKGTQDSKAAN